MVRPLIEERGEKTSPSPPQIWYRSCLRPHGKNDPHITHRILYWRQQNLYLNSISGKIMQLRGLIYESEPKWFLFSTLPATSLPMSCAFSRYARLSKFLRLFIFQIFLRSFECLRVRVKSPGFRDGVTAVNGDFIGQWASVKTNSSCPGNKSLGFSVSLNFF